jgi:hypothetical protein
MCKVGPIFQTVRFMHREQTALFTVIDIPHNKQYDNGTAGLKIKTNSKGTCKGKVHQITGHTDPKVE